ncbi:TadE/TadG family type IV pilus assembly protein [Candidatus Villigracilis saccharophilus]|uniref:DUF7507 domain-containing protein n=1 Tax=Candidatus Villigracilis saccharophilus TaxID=3140684 RepID=UPI003136FA7B|nr:pilus assembly protein [Anaerolineales bacterium]
MIKSQPDKIQKKHAQAMVEFALALPILLILVFGLMETGRLIFIYASTVSAAREAVRYGSAMGRNADNVPLYQDCEGIRRAAQTVGFINSFDDADIQITYDGGIDDDTGAEIPLNPANPSCGSFSSVKNGDRIKISVSTQWEPIVSIVPLEPFTITSTSERTIIASISISAPKILTNAEKTATAVAAQTATAAGVQTATAAAAQTATAAVAQTEIAAAAQTATQVSVNLTSTALATPQQIILSVAVTDPITNPAPLKAGDLIRFDYTITNIGFFPVTGVSIKSAGVNGVTLDAACATTLIGKSSITCKGIRFVSQGDIDTGAALTNTWIASADFISDSNAITTTVNITQTKGLSIFSITGTVNGSNIDYVYKIVNDGNITLSNLSITDDKATITCDSTSLPPNVARTCSGSHPVSQAEINAGSVTNSGTAKAQFGGIDYFSAPAGTTVATGKFTLTVAQNKTNITPSDLTIIYTYTITNTGNFALSKPYNISSTLSSSPLFTGSGSSIPSTPITANCANAAASINPGQSTSCTYTYSYASSTGSSTLFNNSFTASIGSITASSVTPTSLSANAYSCTATNFAVGSLTKTGSQTTWVITNKVGIDIPITSVKIGWSNAGSGSNNVQLTALSVNNSSTLNLGSTLPATTSPYTSGTGTLKGNVISQSVTTVTFTFSKNNHSASNPVLNIAAPYSTCSRP